MTVLTLLLAARLVLAFTPYRLWAVFSHDARPCFGFCLHALNARASCCALVNAFAFGLVPAIVGAVVPGGSRLPENANDPGVDSAVSVVVCLGMFRHYIHHDADDCFGGDTTTLPGIVDIDQVVLVGRHELVSGGEEHVPTRRIRREEIGIIRTAPGGDQRYTTTIAFTTTHTIGNAFVDIFHVTIGVTR